jgi:hypothetical protein
MNNLIRLLPSYYNNISTVDFAAFLKIPSTSSVLGAENDSKQYSNSFKYLLNSKHKKKTIHNFNFALHDNLGSNDLAVKTNDPLNNFSKLLFNSDNTLKFKDYKSSNAQFLGSERTVRLLNNVNSNAYKWNTSASPNLSSAVSANLSTSNSNSQNYLYSSSLSN